MLNLMALHGKGRNGFLTAGGSVRIVFGVSEIPCNNYLAPDDKVAFCLWKQRCLPNEQA